MDKELPVSAWPEWKIIEKIGEGSFGKVYKAQRTERGKSFYSAIKIINIPGSQSELNSVRSETGDEQSTRQYFQNLVEECIQEISTMEYFRGNSYIVSVEDFKVMEYLDVIGWEISIRMEYLTSFMDYCAEKQLTEKEVIKLGMDLSKALEYCRKLKIIHRDIKPENIFVSRFGDFKLGDFGIAREYKEQSLADTTVLGTKGYAPPEQYSGQTDARSDIFALGMTMHHLLTGIDPRSGEAYAPVRMWNPELSEGIELIIDKCVEPAPENRYQNCSDLLYDLEHPDLITRGYKKRQKRKVAAFMAAAGMTVVLFLAGAVCTTIAKNINNSNYEILVSPSTATALNEKIDSYKRAIAIYPERTDAYMCMLEAYEDEGRFGKEENDEFLALYNANKDTFDHTTSEVAELNYKIGMMYFNYYTEEDGSYSFSTRVQKAYSFFAENHNNAEIPQDFEDMNLSECYYQICSFYKNYILNGATVEEASRDNYENLFSTIENTLADVQSAGAYNQLSLYNGIFMLLYDQRSSMVQVNVEQKEIIDLLDNVYDDAKNLTVQKEQSQKLQQEIMEHYDTYRQAIIRAYTNAEERE